MRKRRRDPGPRKLLLEALEDRAVPAAITVTLATDPLGAHTGTSLRDAIKAVNAGLDNTIDFNLPGTGPQVIHLQMTLPAITRTVTIDGTTQPGYGGTPLVGLTPASSSVPGDGLRFFGGGATVEGLAIFGFKGFGLRFRSAANNNVVSDYIGVKPDGAAAGNGAGIMFKHANNDVVSSSIISNNAHRGICVNGSSQVTIGTAGAGNTIAHNGLTGPRSAGIAILGSSGVTVSGNTLMGNGRGIRVSGSGDTSSIVIQNNTITGSKTQAVWVDSSENVTIGGTGTGNSSSSNGPSGSSSAAIAIRDGSSGVTVSGNTLTGNGRGIRSSGSGGTLASGSNTIQDNTGAGQGLSFVSASDVAFLDLAAPATLHESGQGPGQDRAALQLPARGGPPGTDRLFSTPLPPGREALMPPGTGRTDARRTDDTAPEPEAAPEAEGLPKREDLRERGFLPRGVDVIVEGLSAGFAALEEALKALAEPQPLTARRAPVLLRWVGISLWGLAAALTAAAAQRRRHDTHRHVRMGIVGLGRFGGNEEEQP
jgi:parallel beta-helix repeat protein